MTKSLNTKCLQISLIEEDNKVIDNYNGVETNVTAMKSKVTAHLQSVAQNTLCPEVLSSLTICVPPALKPFDGTGSGLK